MPYDEAFIVRVADPLPALIDVAVERDEPLERTAETEAAKRTEAARTAILHATSSLWAASLKLRIDASRRVKTALNIRLPA